MLRIMALLGLIFLLLTGGLSAVAKQPEQPHNGEQDKTEVNQVKTSQPPVEQLMPKIKDVLIQKGDRQNRVKNFQTKDELVEAWTHYLSRDLAERLADQFYQMKDGHLYLVPQCFLPWFDAKSSYQLNQVGDHLYKFKQENVNDLYGRYKLEVMFLKTSGIWKVEAIAINDVKI